MPKIYPAPTRRNAPWTPLQRQTWLAEQRRRRSSLVISITGSTLNITLTGMFPDYFMAVFWNPRDPSPMEELDDIPPTQTSYELSRSMAGWYFVGRINFSDGNPGIPMSNGVYYPG